MGNKGQEEEKHETFMFGTVFSSQTSDFRSVGFSEKKEGKIVFYTLSSKEHWFRRLPMTEMVKLHELFKEAGSYREEKDVMGVYRKYVTEENRPFIERNL